MCSPLTVSGASARGRRAERRADDRRALKAVSVAVPPVPWPVLIVAVLIGLSKVIVSGPVACPPPCAGV